MSQKFITLDDINVSDKRVLIRVDLNVPMKNGKVVNAERIIRSCPSIKELASKNAKVIVLTHLGRPSGAGYEEEFSVKPLVEELSKALGKDVKYVKDCIGSEVESEIAKLKGGDILMLENVRFYKAETKNDVEFTKKLASLGDIYVSDAFSASHRAHSSTEGLAHHLPYAAGRLMQGELDALEKALGNPEKPVLAIVGGAKISTKLDVFHNLVKKAQYIIIGGGMANTFLYANGYDIGKSLCEKDMKDECLKIIAEAKDCGCQLVLPVDATVATEIKLGIETLNVEHGKLPEGYEVFDAGTQTIANFIEVVKKCKTVIWNGPLGVFEVAPFDNGTNSVAKVVAELSRDGKLVSISGGGDTVSALQNAGVYADFTYISTAGGAFLEWMEGKDLPGVVCLLKK
jgi:phosphoglycerate kinase